MKVLFNVPMNVDLSDSQLFAITQEFLCKKARMRITDFVKDGNLYRRPSKEITAEILYGTPPEPELVGVATQFQTDVYNVLQGAYRES